MEENKMRKTHIQSSSIKRDTFILLIFVKVSLSGQNFVFLFHPFWQKSLLLKKSLPFCFERKKLKNLDFLKVFFVKKIDFRKNS